MYFLFVLARSCDDHYWSYYMLKRLFLLSLILLSPCVYSAPTAHISPTPQTLMSTESYVYRGSTQIPVMDSNKYVTTFVDYEAGPNYETSAVPCREGSASPIVIMGFHPIVLHYRFNSSFTKMYNVDTNTQVAFNTLQPTLLWGSPYLSNPIQRNMANYVSGCFWDGIKYTFPTRTETYIRHDKSSHTLPTGSLVVNPTTLKVIPLTENTTLKVPSIATIKTISHLPPVDNNNQVAVTYPNLVTQMTSIIGADKALNVPTQQNFPGTDSALLPYDGLGYTANDLTLLVPSVGLDAKYNNLTKTTTIAKAPSYTFVTGSKLYAGNWCSLAQQRASFNCKDDNGRPLRMSQYNSFGVGHVSNMFEMTYNGTPYVLVAAEHRSIGFMRHGVRNLVYYNSNHSASTSKVQAAWNTDPDVSKYNPYLWSQAPILFRAPKSKMYALGSWEVFGWDTTNSTNPTKANAKWVPICGTCSVDSTLPISVTNVRPYLFFVDNQNSSFIHCNANGNINNCDRYDIRWGAGMMQSFRKINNKIVQIGVDNVGKMYFSYMMSIDNPLLFESTLGAFTQPNGTPIPKCVAVQCTGLTEYEFSLSSDHYLSYFDTNSPATNLPDIQQRTDGTYKGILLVSIKGNKRTGRKITYHVDPQIIKYDLTFSGF